MNRAPVGSVATPSLGGDSKAANYSADSSDNTSVLLRVVPFLVVVAVSTASLLRTGVALGDIARFSTYWVVAVVLPGTLVARALIGARRNIVEDLALGALTGLSLEILSWTIGVALGIGDLARLWWVAVLIAAGVIPGWRGRWVVRVSDQLPFAYSASMAGAISSVVMRLDVFSFRSAPLPPNGGAVYQDLWWHLSLVQELMRFERPQVPQVSGEPLNYHFFSHIHMAVGSRLSGVDPEVVLLRLWLLPVAILSMCLVASLARLVTSRLWAGPAAAWLAFGVSLRTFIWVDLPVNGANPIVYGSPSQVLANVGIVGAAYGFALVFRRGSSGGRLAWLGIIVLGASGSKSTVVPILIAATVVALFVLLAQRGGLRRVIACIVAALLLLQASIFVLASGTAGGKIVLLGTVKSLATYRDLIGDKSLRAVNDGLLLDSLDSPKNLSIGLLTVFVFVTMQSIRIVGMLILTKSGHRNDVLLWWLAGAVVAGLGAALTIDHLGLSQIYFVHSVVPLGIVLSLASLILLTDRLSARMRGVFISSGLAAGIAVTLTIDYVVRARQRSGGYGALDRVLFPMGVALLLGVAGVLAWRNLRTRYRVEGLGVAVLVVLVIGMTIPSELELGARVSYRWVQPVSYEVDASAADFVTSAELEAMVWLRRNSDMGDVLVTNLHCRPTTDQEPLCDSRGFWVVGLSGRRAVLEGWGYTGEAQALQGNDGRPWARQPAPWPERAELVDRLFEHGDSAALEGLHDAYDARWVVHVKRAGRPLDLEAGAADLVFANDGVSIYRIQG